MPLCLYRLIQSAAFIHFALRKNKICSRRHAAIDIICQIPAAAFEKTGILKYDQPALRKKGQSLGKIDHFFDVRLFALVPGTVHCIPIRHHCFYKPVSVLFFEVIFLSVQQIDLFKLSCFQIFIQAFHNSCIIKEIPLL